MIIFFFFFCLLSFHLYRKLLTSLDVKYWNDIANIKNQSKTHTRIIFGIQSAHKNGIEYANLYTKKPLHDLSSQTSNFESFYSKQKQKKHKNQNCNVAKCYQYLYTNQFVPPSNQKVIRQKLVVRPPVKKMSKLFKNGETNSIECVPVCVCDVCLNWIIIHWFVSELEANRIKLVARARQRSIA